MRTNNRVFHPQEKKVNIHYKKKFLFAGQKFNKTTCRSASMLHLWMLQYYGIFSRV